MKLYEDSIVRVELDTLDHGRWVVLVANPPHNSWLNVPCSFATEEAAERVADAIRRETADD